MTEDEAAHEDAAALSVTPADRRTLEEWSARGDDSALARRARIVLRASEGASTSRIAWELGVSRPTVTLWRGRFIEAGLDGIARIKQGRGRRSTLPPEKVRLILDVSHRPPPPGHARWTVRAMAAHAGVSPDTVQRLWRDHGVRPHAAPATAVGERPGTEDRGHAPMLVDPPASATEPAHHLPVPFSSFVGRQRELSEVAGLLGGTRLVTLTGGPGVGKTRLALETATRLLPERAGDACFVELAPVAAPRLVAYAVASAVGIREHAGEELAETLVAGLRHRQLLLVLDNCEHVLSACADLVQALLPACPHLTVLATSQEPLGVPGERVWQVPPLALPAPDDSCEALESSEAIRLFCERAGAQVETFALTRETLADVAEICRRLDGNPLAIELAAARAGAMSPAAILERLEQRFRLLTSGRRGGPARHRTLEAAIAWSFDLLPDRHQTLLRRLSVFAGEITLEAAEKVCDGDGLTGDVFYLLASLVERSLVVAEVAGRHARYRLLETIGAFARERLVESGEADRVRSRFVAWCTELVEQAEPELTGATQQDWLSRLEGEHDNIIAAIECSLAAGQVEQALRIAGAMAAFWRLRGYLRKGANLLEGCLAAAGSGVPEDVRLKAAWGAGLLAAMLGDFATAQVRGEESLRSAERLGDPAAAARALTLLGSVRMYRGSPAAAAELLEEGVLRARRAQDMRCLVDALGRCGQAHMLRVDYKAALPLFAECYDVARQLGDRQAETFALVGQGWAAMDLGDDAVGETRIRQALEIARALGDRFRTGETLAFLGELSRRRGDLPEAEALFAECRQVAQAIRAPLLQARSLGGLGRVELSLQRYEAARAYFDRGIAIAREVGLPYVLTRMLLGASACAHALGDDAAAEDLLAEALAHARTHADSQGTATALYASAVCARRKGCLDRAALLHADALQMHVDADDTESVARSLEGLAGIALDREQFVFAARLFGAAAASWRRVGCRCARWPWEQERYDRDLARLGRALPADALRAAWHEGAERSRQDVVGYALRRTGGRRRSAEGRAGLTPSELEVVRLVVQGLTSREVAERLFVSPRTVDAHLGRIYRKLGIRSRQQLRELVEAMPELQLTGA
ncbi:MAG TPA: tetratricopeptide repeat protein [Egibacteraceae bacterium]|nr:tetratricopeptide repeat protein [Egibacteraceae bacterium]